DFALLHPQLERRCSPTRQRSSPLPTTRSPTCDGASADVWRALPWRRVWVLPLPVQRGRMRTGIRMATVTSPITTGTRPVTATPGTAPATRLIATITATAVTAITTDTRQDITDTASAASLALRRDAPITVAD